MSLTEGVKQEDAEAWERNRSAGLPKYCGQIDLAAFLQVANGLSSKAA